ncbi:hypothetical protein C8J57DRAFT_1276588 [Mycena rebaudengoi]|nr:hypothetical protein C8J57DRAFT_1276588 [Mycena rebaudengoi]
MTKESMFRHPFPAPIPGRNSSIVDFHEFPQLLLHSPPRCEFNIRALRIHVFHRPDYMALILVACADSVHVEILAENVEPHWFLFLPGDDFIIGADKSRGVEVEVRYFEPPQLRFDLPNCEGTGSASRDKYWLVKFITVKQRPRCRVDDRIFTRADSEECTVNAGGGRAQIDVARNKGHLGRRRCVHEGQGAKGKREDVEEHVSCVVE